MKAEKITMAHGSGGYDSQELMREVFAKHFSNAILNRLEDAAVLESSSSIAVSTDTFVVQPLEFPGGDIGKLAVVGTVNDVLMSGAVPKYLTCGFVLESGLDITVLDRICESMAAAAAAAGIAIVSGDTKVVEHRTENRTDMGSKGDAGREPIADTAAPGLTINSTGIGFMPAAAALPSPSGLREGDRVILTGTLGDHHACILSARMGIQNGIVSDCALLSPAVEALNAANIPVHAMRDVTRGGLGTVLNELATASNVMIEIEETSVPVEPQVRAFCGVMGLDPIYMGNEGKMVFAVTPEYAEKALAAVRGTEIGKQAAIIGEVKAIEKKQGMIAPRVTKRTPIGGTVRVDVLYGEGLPRIC